MISIYPVGKLRVYWLKTLKKLSIYPLGNTPSAPSGWEGGRRLRGLKQRGGGGCWSLRLGSGGGCQSLLYVVDTVVGCREWNRWLVDGGEDNSLNGLKSIERVEGVNERFVKVSEILTCPFLGTCSWNGW